MNSVIKCNISNSISCTRDDIPNIRILYNPRPFFSPFVAPIQIFTLQKKKPKDTLVQAV